MPGRAEHPEQEDAQMAKEKQPAAPKDGDKYTRLASNTVIFAISSFSSKLLTFVVQPLLTHVMKETSVVGVSKLASQCANLLIPLVGMGISAVIYGCFDLSPAGNGDNFPSVILGIALILASLIFRYGAELEAKASVR